MGIGGHVAAQRLGDLDLHGGVHHVIFAADDMGDAEVDVIDDRGQGVEIAAILAHQHRVRQRGRVDVLAPTDQIVPLDHAAIEPETPMGLSPLGLELRFLLG